MASKALTARAAGARGRVRALGGAGASGEGPGVASTWTGGGVRSATVVLVMSHDATGAGAGAARRVSAWPAVSVVVPVLNEERHLEARRDERAGPGVPGAMEIVLAVGPSRDRTHDVAAALAARDARVAPRRQPHRQDPRRPQRGDRGLDRRRSSSGSTRTANCRRATSAAPWSCWTAPARTTSAA